jgi:hypothetical protein
VLRSRKTARADGVDEKHKLRITTPKATFNKKILFTSRLDINLKKTLVDCYVWSIAFYGAETKTLWKVDQKYLGNCEMWCWRRMEIRWTDHVRNEEERDCSAPGCPH